MQPALAVTEPDDELDQVLLQGWRLSQQLVPPPTATRRSIDLEAQHHTVRGTILLMWQQRASLRALAGADKVEEGGQSLKTLWDAWTATAKLQATTRQLRRACRRRKTLRILEAVNSEIIHQAAKKFGPKQVRRRQQLRSEEGHIQSQEAEFQQILTYFKTLFSGPGHTPVTLSQDMVFTEEELQQALSRLAAGKAMPAPSAPAALWKLVTQQAAPALLRQFHHYLQAGAAMLPLRFNLSELVVIPKPGKPLRSPEQLRPINLLSLQAKTLGAMIAARLQPYAADFLQEIPQYAYLGGRSLGMALERLAGHCSMVRKLLQDQPQTLHARRAGRQAAKVCGGAHLSLDVSKAYDRVPWHDLVQALREAQVPESLIELILLIHQQACVQISHNGYTDYARMGKGLRQGCGLAPILWTIYPGWVLKGLHQPPILDVTAGNTTYADDFHFGWTIRTGLDMEQTYAAMKHILTGLRNKGILVSIEKTVAILELQGPGASACLARYVVVRPQHQGKFLRFVINGESEYIKIVPHHVYLGVVIGFKKYDQATARHRMDLAKGTFSRLSSVLKCRDVAVRLRLLLWQGTVLPTLLHGLDCTGLPSQEASQLMVMFYKQARSIAKSYSMFTHESNQDLARRLRLPNPLRRLLQAIDRRASADLYGPELLQPGGVQLQWRAYVRGQLVDAQGAHRTHKPTESKCSLQLVEDILPEKFCCDVCGQEYGTQASLKRHMFRQHLDEDTQLQTLGENRRQRRAEAMTHAKDGMPLCRHCHHEFTTWPAFFYHVSARGCSGLRNFFGNDGVPIETVAEDQESAVTEDKDILQLTQHCSWKDLALHPKVRAKHQHCPECNLWVVRTQYIKRHMLLKHPAQHALIERSEQLIVQSDLSLSNPCQYCGLKYQRKSAHLKSCIGIFSGVYLHLRLARGRPLKDLVIGCGDGDRGRSQPNVTGDQGAGAAEIVCPPECIPGPAKSELNFNDTAILPQPGILGNGAAAQVPQGKPQGKRRQQKGRRREETSGDIRQLLAGVKTPRTEGSRQEQGQGQEQRGQEMGTVEPVERGGTSRGQPGGGTGDPSDVGDDGAKAGSPSPYPKTGYLIRPLHPDALGAQCGDVNLRGGPEVACDEGHHAREAGVADEGAVISTPHTTGDTEVRDDGGELLLEIHSGVTGMVEQGGDPCQWGAMGPGATHPCPGPDRSGDTHCGGPGSLGGDHFEMHQAASHRPLPRDEEAGVRLSVTHPHDATRGGVEGRSGERSVEALAPTSAIGNLGSGRHIPTTRNDASQCLGAADCCPGKVRALKLGNRGNFCYANATLKCIMYASAFKGGLGTVFNGGLLRFLRQILQQGGTTHLWSQPFWVAVMAGWREPHRQHDGAEYLEFLLAGQPYTAEALATHWQARTLQDGSYVTVDGGSSAPLLINPPEWARSDSQYSATTQELLQGWHAQVDMHAALWPPEFLVLQVGRFEYDAVAGRSLKRRFAVVPDLIVNLPCYVRDMQTRNTAYHLRTALVHKGLSASSGHYVALMYDEDDSHQQKVWIADDGATATQTDDHEVARLFRDIYMLFYTKVE